MTPETPYSNRELDTKFETVTKASDSNRETIMNAMGRQDKVLGEIQTQTKATNGRVNVLQLRMYIAFTAIVVILALKFPDIINLLKVI